MIVVKMWTKSYTNKLGSRRYEEDWRGWFLFGFLPIYLVCTRQVIR